MFMADFDWRRISQKPSSNRQFLYINQQVYGVSFSINMLNIDVKMFCLIGQYDFIDGRLIECKALIGFKPIRIKRYKLFF